MKTILVSALALGALTSAALAAEPLRLSDKQLRLSDKQMDTITAGAISFMTGPSSTVAGGDSSTGTSTSGFSGGLPFSQSAPGSSFSAHCNTNCTLNLNE